MKNSHGSRQRRFTSAARRAQLLAAFDRSGLSAAEFSRQHSLNYTTFCGWRSQRDRANGSPGFVQVELPEPMPPVELVVELGAVPRLRLTAEGQIPLAARLLQALHPAVSC